ncbi:MAG: MBOAT family O-acyltransferase [Lachnospiraceae bacterium]|nr:MBOAT family O-acyltransferase [Lachnospiraceae bacterium]
MQYNTWLYLLAFLPLTLAAYYLLPLRLRYLALLAASIVFYTISCGSRILILIGSTLVIYITGCLLEQISEKFQEKKKELSKDERKLLKKQVEHQKRLLLTFSCLLLAGILVLTKYLNFFCSNLNILFEQLKISAHIPAFHFLMPLGISFYTLSAISYLTDISRQGAKAQKNFLKLLLFLMFFPVIVEGPISRYSKLGNQLEEGHSFQYQSFCMGLQLMLWGLCKKVLIADRMNRYVKYVFNSYENIPSPVIALGICCYTFQIYMEFSGCMDIVTGSAQLFGIELEKNFQRPFFSKNVNEFWRRWHITLGSWLRDYIFYPISISHPFQKLSKTARKHLPVYYASALPMIAALFAVWFGNGIWHGAEWKYIVYGLYYYAIVVLGMLLEPAFQKAALAFSINRESVWYHRFQIFRTFCLVNLGMLIFRADSLTKAAEMFRALLFNGFSTKETMSEALLGHGAGVLEWTLLLAFLLLVLFIGICQEKGIHIRETIASWPVFWRFGLYLTTICIVVTAGAYGVGFGPVDFIYAQF